MGLAAEMDGLMIAWRKREKFYVVLGIVWKGLCGQVIALKAPGLGMRINCSTMIAYFRADHVSRYV